MNATKKTPAPSAYQIRLAFMSYWLGSRRPKYQALARRYGLTIKQVGDIVQRRKYRAVTQRQSEVYGKK